MRVETGPKVITATPDPMGDCKARIAKMAADAKEIEQVATKIPNDGLPVMLRMQLVGADQIGRRRGRSPAGDRRRERPGELCEQDRAAAGSGNSLGQHLEPEEPRQPAGGSGERRLIVHSDEETSLPNEEDDRQTEISSVGSTKRRRCNRVVPPVDKRMISYQTLIEVTRDSSNEST